MICIKEKLAYYHINNVDRGVFRFYLFIVLFGPSKNVYSSDLYKQFAI